MTAAMGVLLRGPRWVLCFEGRSGSMDRDGCLACRATLVREPRWVLCSEGHSDYSPAFVPCSASVGSPAGPFLGLLLGTSSMAVMGALPRGPRWVLCFEGRFWLGGRDGCFATRAAVDGRPRGPLWFGGLDEYLASRIAMDALPRGLDGCFASRAVSASSPRCRQFRSRIARP